MQSFYGIGLRAISLNTLFQFAVRLVGSFSSLVATLIIASFMGYSTIGSFVKVIEFVSIFYLLLDFGLNPVFLKLHKEKTDEMLGNLVLIRLFMASLIIPLILVLVMLLPNNTLAGTGFSNAEKLAIVIYSITLLSASLNLSFQAILQQKLASRLTLIPSLLGSTIFLAIIFFAAKSGNFNMLFVGFLISGAIYSTTVYSILKKRYHISLVGSKVYIFGRKLLLSSWPLGVVLFINLLYVKADIFLLALFKQNIDVGVYGISYRFFDVAISIPTFLAASTYPLLLKHMGGAKYSSLFKKYLIFYALIATVITPIAIFATPLIQIFKSEFILSVAPLQILLLSLPFFFLTSLLQWHFIIKNKIKFLVPLYAGVLVLNVMLNIIFIPRYSYYASAIITGLSEILVFLVMLWYFISSKKKELD